MKGEILKPLRIFLIGFLLLTLLAGLSPFREASAQMFSSYKSSVAVQNLNDDEVTITLEYYFGGEGPNAGDIAYSVTGETLDAFGVAEYAALPLPSFEGSLVISSDKPIGAVSVLNGDNKGRGMYTGSSSGSTKVVLPFMMNNWGVSGWNTFFSVQNVGTATATVNIDYARCPGLIDDTVTIEPNAMKIVDQAAEPCLSNQGRVITSATLTSDQPIAVVVSQESKIVKSALVSNGYSVGSPYPVIPLVNSNNPTPKDWRTAIAMFNLDPVESTTVTLQYVRKDGFICEETRAIAPNSSTEFGGNAFILGSPSLTCPKGVRFIGAAYVTFNSNEVDLVATVNQDRGTLASSYSSFNKEDATSRIAFPRFVNRYGGAEDWDSTFTVMNVGTDSIYVECEYINSTYTSKLGLIEPFGVREDLPRYSLPANYFGGGVCTAYSDPGYSVIDSTAKIIGIVNTRGHGIGYNDLMMTYEAVNVPQP